MIELLHGDGTRFVLVASPRVDTIDEARFFADRLVDKDIEVSAIIVNRATPDFGEPDGQAAEDHRRRGAVRQPAQLHELAVGERDHIAPLVADTDREPTWVPLLAGDVHDLDALDTIRTLLFAGSAARGDEPVGSAPCTSWSQPTPTTSLDDVTAALGGPDVSFTVCRNGRDVAGVVESAHTRPRRARSADRVDGRNGRDDVAAARRELRRGCHTSRC